jgi:hypothetical protein
MKLMLNVTFSLEKFNAAVRDGSAGKKMQRILEELKPEAAYFTERNGRRGCSLIVQLDKPSQVPKFAEPWFLLFDAECEFRIVMSPEDVAQAGLEELGKKWA